MSAMRSHNKEKTILLWLLSTCLLCIWPMDGSTDELQVKKRDVDQNGIVDRIAEFDQQGILVTLTADDDGDGVMDRFQTYAEGVIQRLDQDLDADGRIDTRFHFKSGRKKRQQRLNENGDIVQEIVFDDAGDTIEIHEDTNQDRHMDTVYHYKGELITRIERSQNGDGGMHIVEQYQNGKLADRSHDKNGDGKIEERLYFDTAGSLSKRRLDTDADGDMDLLETYRNGEVHEQWWDHDQDGHFERMAAFDQGRLAQVEEDSDLDGFRETRVTYGQGKPTHQMVDENQDGIADLAVYFNPQGMTVRLEKDTTSNGKMDTFHHFQDNRLVSVERDTNGDGKIDKKISYQAGGKVGSVAEDSDHDGRFERIDRYDQSPWTLVSELDVSDSSKSGLRSYYMHDILRRREYTQEGSHLVVRRENFDERGCLAESMEDKDADGDWEMKWYYNAQGRYQRAEADTDADNRMDTWYDYADGRITRISKDTNDDGNPDVWDHYGASQKVIKRQRDLDFDGKVDTEKSY